jgi:translation initiation factor 2B subunit (eIF-2B alpha/beta/delta family)
MCSIANAISWVADSILGRAEGKSVEELKTLTRACASYAKEELKRRSLLACYKAQDLIVSGDSIMTASYSSQVVSTFRRAKDMGKMFTILALESLSQGKSYGEMLALELKKENIKVLVIPDVDIARSVALANKVLIGSDAILPQGYVINGIPSLHLAKVAQRNHLPFYVVGEMIKVSPHFFEPDQGFDMIPPSLITWIITDQEIHGEDQILRPRI